MSILDAPGDNNPAPTLYPRSRSARPSVYDRDTRLDALTKLMSDKATERGDASLFELGQALSILAHTDDAEDQEYVLSACIQWMHREIDEDD